jgi:CO/xanthine dehydrogenase FAD-binding subunit
MALEIVRPDSVRSAAEMLASPHARFVAGGTISVRVWNSGDVSIKKLVLSDGLGLDAISVANGRAEIGAAVTMAKVAAHPDLAFLRGVAGEIGGPAIRAMATVGGNLFARSPYGDFAVALLALDAEVTVEDARTTKSRSIAAFLAARDRHAGIVRSAAFALPPAGSFRFAKVMRRHPHGASVLSIAALLPLAGGRMKGVRVAYGAMAPTAIRATAVEKALEGKALDEASIADAVAVAGKGTAPVSDAFASDWYRLNVLPVHLARLLRGE